MHCSIDVCIFSQLALSEILIGSLCIDVVALLPFCRGVQQETKDTIVADKQRIEKSTVATKNSMRLHMPVLYALSRLVGGWWLSVVVCLSTHI